MESYYFCYFGPHAKFQNLRTNISGRKGTEEERVRERGGEKTPLSVLPETVQS